MSLLQKFSELIQTPQNVKSEQGASASKDQSKDFLFDPYAAAYYARFTDFNPQKHSLTAFFIASETNSNAANS